MFTYIYVTLHLLVLITFLTITFLDHIDITNKHYFGVY